MRLPENEPVMEFQFLYGSIKRYPVDARLLSSVNFNSFMGRLKARGVVMDNVAYENFNSFMGRLKVV